MANTDEKDDEKELEELESDTEASDSDASDRDLTANRQSHNRHERRQMRLPVKQLRRMAGMEFQSNPKIVKPADLKLLDDFRTVPATTLIRWCKEDNWYEHRQKFIDSWAAEAQQRIGSVMVQERIKNYEKITKMEQEAMDKLLNEPIKVKSYEGLMRTTMDLLKYKEQLASDIGQELRPPERPTALERPSDYEADEFERVARQALEAVRQSQNEQRRLASAGGATAPKSEQKQLPTPDRGSDLALHSERGDQRDTELVPRSEE